MFIPGYKLERKLGQGGMAVVYLAIQESLQRPVALKVLNPVFSDTPAFSERFLNEGRILASLQHSNIITIHDIGVVGDLHYISMEYVEGSDLRTKIKQGVSADQALAYVSTIASCLATAHVKNVVHRDIKPANILFRTDDTLLLTDFGIAKRMDGQDITEVGTTLGSPSYLSPEQAQSKEVDGRSDIYSVGVIFFEMLTGRKPYRGETDIDTIVMHKNDPVPRLPEHLGAYQPLLDQMMAKQPQERFSSAAQIVDFIDQLDVCPAASNPSQTAKTFFTRVTDEPADVTQVTKTLILRPGDGRPTQAVEAFPPPPVESVAAPASRAPRRALYAGVASVALLGTLGAFGLYQPAEPPTEPDALVEHPDQDHSLVRQPEERVKEILAHANTADNSKAFEEEEPALAPTVTITDPTQVETLSDAARVQGLPAASSPAAVAAAPNPDTPVTVASLAKPPPLDGARPPVPNAPPPAASAAETTPPKPAAPKPVAAKRPKPDQPAPTTVDPAVPPTVELDTAEIERLLGSADAAIAANRLTDPRGNSALDFYKDVLELDPNNAEAQSGFTRIGNRYAWLAHQALDNYETKSAEHFVKRGLEVDPYNRRLLSLRNEMQARARDLTIVQGSNRFQEESNIAARERRARARVGETPRALVHRIKKFFN